MGIFNVLKTTASAIAGNPAAQVETGRDALRQGNMEFARSLFVKAAGKGNTDGMVLWGQMLMHNATHPVDVMAGLIQISKAATFGHMEATVILTDAFQRVEVELLLSMDKNQLETTQAMVLSAPHRTADALEVKLAGDLVKSIVIAKEGGPYGD